MGSIVVQAMNAVGYDAMALGEYELRLGRTALQARIGAAEFPVVSANAFWLSGERVVEPYTVLQVAGHRIGVVGLTRQPDAQIDDVQVRDPRQALEEILPEVAAKAETLVVLTSIDFQGAQQLVSDRPEVDLLIAALPFPLLDHALRLEPSGTIAVSAEAPSAGHTGRRVGRLSITVEADGSLTGEEWATVAVDKSLAEDPAMKELLDRQGG